MALSSTQEETLSTFVAMTQADEKTAKEFLKATSWDINTAMDRFFAFGGDVSKLGPPKSNNYNNNNNNGASSNGSSSNPPTLVNRLSQGLLSGMSGVSAMFQQPQSQTDQDALLARQLAQQSQPSSSAYQDPYGGGIRAPDAAFQERLVGPYTNQFGSSTFKQRRDQQENFANDWKKGPKNQKSTFLGALFSDPDYKFGGSLEDAKKKGARENKWLLINIQDTENFCSHCLNRDIWKDKDLMPILRESFVFYQWISKTDNARRVINLYHPTKFPCIFVVDPSTGRQEYEFTVPETPDKIATLKPKLIEFLDDYPNPKAKPKRAPPKPLPKPIPKMDPEEKALQEALALSMAEAKNDEQKQEQQQQNNNTNNNNNNNNNNDKTDTMDVDDNNDDDDNNQQQQEEQEEEQEQLQPQPDGQDKNAAAIRVRMPNGSILQRLFYQNSKVSQLYIWCKLSLNGKDVSLLQTMPRLKLDDHKDKTLRELGLIRATLVCSYDD